tara:strand:+ start:254 stop:1696 length:1443 start_codon:yes stop_codon:yes gene_type:complete
MSDTAKFESAQALFCAIADKIGTSKVDEVLDTDLFEDFESFESNNKKLVKDSMNHINVDVPYSEIKAFLLANKSWYISSIKIAKKLLKDLSKEVDSDFSDIIKPGFQRNYLRGDMNVVNIITDLFNIANANTLYNNKVLKMPKFGDINKWSPADIYYSREKSSTDGVATVVQELLNEKTAANANKKAYNFAKLNTFISLKISQGDLLPLSLKKAEKDVVIKKVNFRADVKAKLIDGIYDKQSNSIKGGLWHTSDQSGSTKEMGSKGWKAWKKYPALKRIKFKNTNYGEPINATELSKQVTSSLYVLVSNNSTRSTSVGFIQMRHDRSGASWKVDFSYSVGGGRGGSVVSDSLFADLLNIVDTKVATAFRTAYKEGNAEYKAALKDLNIYKKGIKELNEKNKKTKKTLFPGKSPTAFDNIRGELSSILVTNRVHKVLQDWFNKNSKNTPKGKTNKVDEFIRILFRYVTSRSPVSAKFVIAK